MQWYDIAVCVRIRVARILVGLQKKSKVANHMRMRVTRKYLANSLNCASCNMYVNESCNGAKSQ